MYCGQCGAKTHERNNYCEKCGAKLASTSQLEESVSEEDQLKSVSDYRDQLNFIQEVQDISSEVGAAVNECIAILKKPVKTCRLIVEYAKSNEESAGNISYDITHDGIGDQVQAYLTHRPWAENKIQKQKGLIDELHQLSPNPKFSGSKTHYAEWIRKFKLFFDTINDIFDGIDRGLKIENEQVIVDIENLGITYLQGDNPFGDSIQGITEAVEQLEDESSKLTLSISRDYKSIKNIPN